jgi:branched-chain amino acid transport system permease protein
MSSRPDLLFQLAVLATFLWIAVVRNDAYLSTVAATAALYAISAVGLNLVFGYSGDLSLGQAAFYAAGVYGTVLAGNRLHLTYVAAAVLGVGAATGAAAIVGIAALRARGLYLAMITVAAGLVAYSVAQGWIAVTGGPEGLGVLRTLTIAGKYVTPQRFLILTGVVLTVVLWLASNLAKHHWGRVWKATQASRIAAEACGIHTYRLRITAFVIAGMLTGLAGALYPVQTGYITSDIFSMDYSVFVLLAVLVGGAGTIAGPVIGAAALVGFLNIFGASLGALTNLVYGALFILIIYVAPAGFVGTLTRATKVIRHLVIANAAIEDTIEDPLSMSDLRRSWGHFEPDRSDNILEILEISKRFFGVHALDSATLKVKAGTIHGLIGANGSGKSTMLNVVMGIYRCDSGKVIFRGDEVQGRRPYRVARCGIARTFQTSELFKGLTVRENVMAASAITRDDGLFAQATRLPRARRRDAAARCEATALLALVGLRAEADSPIESLAPGQGRLLEVARALATRPALIALDEPAAGLDAHEVETLADTLAAVRDAGITVLIVEHRMELIAALADQVTVLERGRTIAQDTPRRIQENQAVISAYLGDIKLAV